MSGLSPLVSNIIGKTSINSYYPVYLGGMTEISCFAINRKFKKNAIIINILFSTCNHERSYNYCKISHFDFD